MQVHNLLLARKYSERPEHVHDGKVIVMRSNLRWCSDGFEFSCWNGDIMLEAVERRFGAYRAPAVIEMLSDNGPPYIAKDTQIFARQLGLKPCFTPVQSPQSNGI